MHISIFGKNIRQGKNSYMVNKFGTGYVIKVNQEGNFKVVYGDWLAELRDELISLGFNITMDIESILVSEGADIQF